MPKTSKDGSKNNKTSSSGMNFSSPSPATNMLALQQLQSQLSGMNQSNSLQQLFQSNQNSGSQLQLLSQLVQGQQNAPQLQGNPDMQNYFSMLLGLQSSLTKQLYDTLSNMMGMSSMSNFGMPFGFPNPMLQQQALMQMFQQQMSNSSSGMPNLQQLAQQMGVKSEFVPPTSSRTMEGLKEEEKQQTQQFTPQLAGMMYMMQGLQNKSPLDNNDPDGLAQIDEILKKKQENRGTSRIKKEKNGFKVQAEDEPKQKREKTRHKERSVREVMKVLIQWRCQYNGILDPNTKAFRKVSLQDAADTVGIPRKSLDDYFLVIKQAKHLGYNIRGNLDERFGKVRAFVKENRHKLEGIAKEVDNITFDNLTELSAEQEHRPDSSPDFKNYIADIAYLKHQKILLWEVISAIFEIATEADLEAINELKGLVRQENSINCSVFKNRIKQRPSILKYYIRKLADGLKYKYEFERNINQKFSLMEEFVYSILYRVEADFSEYTANPEIIAYYQKTKAEIEAEDATISRVRHSERSVLEVKNILTDWRLLYEGPFNKKRLSLCEAAKAIGASRKSLDDYYMHIRQATRNGFDVDKREQDMFGFVRKYNKMKQPTENPTENELFGNGLDVEEYDDDDDDDDDDKDSQLKEFNNGLQILPEKLSSTDKFDDEEIKEEGDELDSLASPTLMKSGNQSEIAVEDDEMNLEKKDEKLKGGCKPNEDDLKNKKDFDENDDEDENGSGDGSSKLKENAARLSQSNPNSSSDQGIIEEKNSKQGSMKSQQAAATAAEGLIKQSKKIQKRPKPDDEINIPAIDIAYQPSPTDFSKDLDRDEFFDLKLEMILEKDSNFDNFGDLSQREDTDSVQDSLTDYLKSYERTKKIILKRKNRARDPLNEEEAKENGKATENPKFKEIFDQEMRKAKKNVKLRKSTLRSQKMHENYPQIKGEDHIENIYQKTKFKTGEKNHRFRHSERSIRQVVELIQKWRCYLHGVIDPKTQQFEKMTLGQSAKKLGVPRKSLDDYLLKIKQAILMKFDVGKHLDQKFGLIRSFVKNPEAYPELMIQKDGDKSNNLKGISLNAIIDDAEAIDRVKQEESDEPIQEQMKEIVAPGVSDGAPRFDYDADEFKAIVIERSRKRHAERSLKQVLELVKKWRSYRKGVADPQAPGGIRKLSLEVAASKVGVPRKSLDDYLLILKRAQQSGFDFEKYMNEGFGLVRAFTKSKKKGGPINHAKGLSKEDYEAIFG